MCALANKQLSDVEQTKKQSSCVPHMFYGVPCPCGFSIGVGSGGSNLVTELRCASLMIIIKKYYNCHYHVSTSLLSWSSSSSSLVVLLLLL